MLGRLSRSPSLGVLKVGEAEHEEIEGGEDGLDGERGKDLLSES